MTAAAFLTRLYPPAVRQRWGADIAREVSAAGIRSWPDTLTGAARLWLHPADWPETFTGQTRHVLTVTLAALTATTALLLRTTAPSAALTADRHHPVTSLWLLPVLIGVAVAAPLPSLRARTLRRLAAAVVRTMTAPAAALLALLCLAWSGVARHATGPADTAMTAYYWLTLAFTALRACTLIARITPTTTVPSTRRLSAALVLVGTGLALATGQNLTAALRSGHHPGAFAQTVALALLAATALTVGRDLRQWKKA